MIKPAKEQKKVGAALVIGGGVAGIQASLDLAESGIKVYLLESSPAIGGNMARLDKTFPTNDCSMCILSPKIVECGRHLNIETITWSQLEEVSGEAGNYKVKVRKKARYVDLDKCTGCGDCAKVCPVNLIDEFDAELRDRQAVYRPYPQAFPNAYVIDKRGKSPCRIGCPAGINIHAYVALTAQGKYDEALDVVLDTVPLPGVLGRICDHPCETECQLSCGNEPVSICALKRFLADKRRANGYKVEPKVEQKLAKVAIIGGGPAGLAAARKLARMGYRPEIFEGRDKAGGMLRWGIPDYRLPADILDEEITDVLDEGVKLHLNKKLGRDITVEQLKKDGFEAVIMAVGAQLGSKFDVAGSEYKGFVDCIEFLDKANSEGRTVVGRKVTVIGGGNSAIDAARVSLRLGAEQVTIVYRRSRTEMPAIEEEIVAAEHEGVKIEYLASPGRLIADGDKVKAMECVRMKLGEPDSSGRRRPMVIDGSQFTIETDMVISAIGQKVDMPYDDEVAKGIEINKWGTIAANEYDATTNIKGVFAAGDAVTGPQSVIKAIGAGNNAAVAADCYLRGVDFEPEYKVSDDEVTKEPPLAQEAQKKDARYRFSEIEPAKAIRSFDEVASVLTDEQAAAEAKRCLNCAICSECMACVSACKADAIDHSMKDKIEDIDVGAIVVLPGFEEFAAKLKYDYGYSQFADVVSSIQFERILSASGPYAGHVKRPSDGVTPERIAFLQCVGSRDISCRNEFCSSVCCTYAIKEAMIVKEHMKDVDVTVFFMDLRAFGKDFDKYYERAKSEYGVKFVRARVSDVERNSDGKLVVQYSSENGQVDVQDFDMVVLSVGLEPAVNSKKLAKKLGVRLNSNGYIWTDPTAPLNTSRSGIFVGGAASGPKDIPETVTQASGSASMAMQLLAEVRGTLTTEQEFPPEKDIDGIEPRIGVFVCHCGINIGGYVDVPGVAEYIKTLPYVRYAEDNLYTCSQNTQDHMRDMILEHDLNRVVVASCSPRTHEPLFQQTLREAGLNPHLFDMANIRDQCSWVHMNEPEKATEKAKNLVRMTIARAAFSEPLESELVDVSASALVIGGGLAGMTSALAIAGQGFEVTLVEKTDRLGGNLNRVHYTLEKPDMDSFTAELIDKVNSHENIKVQTNMTLEKTDGFVGNFSSTLKNGSKITTIEHGAVIVATGGNEYKPEEYQYGKNDRVMTQLELEEKLAQAEGFSGVDSVVMIQCVGSREPGHMYCSKICCAGAVKNALKIKELSPETQVYVLYRDVRTYSFAEKYYRQARDKGVVFIRYDLDSKPEVVGGKDITVSVREPMLDSVIEFKPDMLVLSSRIDADMENNETIGKMLKIPQNEDGFFLEAHVKLRPVEFATEGVFVAGLAHNPKSISETIAQAQAAAAKACTILAKDKYQAQACIAEVDTDACAGCGACVYVCAYKAIEVVVVDEKTGQRAAQVNPVLCKGCGTCAATCRSGAVDVKGITDDQINRAIKAL